MDIGPFYNSIDPVAVSLGPLQIHWYGIMYMAGFMAFLAKGVWVAKNRSWWGWQPSEVSDFLFYGMLGVIIGGRVGYALFYGFDRLLDNPLFLLKIWDGGMSFHGGLLGVMAATLWFGRKTGRGFWRTADFIVPLVPLGLAFGRIGNYIGGELWGRHTDMPWGVIFPNAIMTDGWKSPELFYQYMEFKLDNEARHPSQLYEAFLEGFVLYFILAWFSKDPRKRGSISGLFLLGYGSFRFFVEFFREPDSHLGFLAQDWLTMGHILSIPMIAGGIGLIIWSRSQPVFIEESSVDTTVNQPAEEGA